MSVAFFMSELHGASLLAWRLATICLMVCCARSTHAIELTLCGSFFLLAVPLSTRYAVNVGPNSLPRSVLTSLGWTLLFRPMILRYAAKTCASVLSCNFSVQTNLLKTSVAVSTYLWPPGCLLRLLKSNKSSCHQGF